MSSPPSLFTSMRRPMHGTSCPKSQLKSTCLNAKFGSFLDHAETGEKWQNVISSSVQHPISLIFAIHVSFILPLPMMWILLTKPMQKYVTTVCLHCSFARLRNKHIGVLGTNVATIAGYIGPQCLVYKSCSQSPSLNMWKSTIINTKKTLRGKRNKSGISAISHYFQLYNFLSSMKEENTLWNIFLSFNHLEHVTMHK